MRGYRIHHLLVKTRIGFSGVKSSLHQDCGIIKINRGIEAIVPTIIVDHLDTIPLGARLQRFVCDVVVIRLPAVRPSIGSVAKIFSGRRAGFAVMYSDSVRFMSNLTSVLPRRVGSGAFLGPIEQV
jgi:hypothetical protein